RNNTVGTKNTATGRLALISNTDGIGNTATGYGALADNTQGNGNTAIGLNALLNNVTGSNNIALGTTAGSSISTANNVICIGASVAGYDADNICFIGNIFGSAVANGAQVIIDSNHHLGTVASSRRFKNDIRPMEEASETIFSLQPVTFRYKKNIDPTGTAQ